MHGSIRIARLGVELGSWPDAEARALLEADFLKPTDDYWRKGMQQWRPLMELEDARPVEQPAPWTRNVRERVRTAAGDAARFARKIQEVARSSSASFTKTRERVLEDFLPHLRLLVATQLKQPALNVDAVLKDEEAMKKVFGAVFDCLPKPVTRFVAEEQFVKFCMKHKGSLVSRDETAGGAGG